jgi:hypothetical protein
MDEESTQGIFLCQELQANGRGIHSRKGYSFGNYQLIGADSGQQDQNAQKNPLKGNNSRIIAS